jgi:hypothetical protein
MELEYGPYFRDEERKRNKAANNEEIDNLRNMIS